MLFPYNPTDYTFYILECLVKEKDLIDVLKKFAGPHKICCKLSFNPENKDGYPFRLEVDFGGNLKQNKKFILPFVQDAPIKNAYLEEVFHRACGDGSSYDTKRRTIKHRIEMTAEE